MITLSLNRLLAGAAGLALSLAAGAGVAAAVPAANPNPAVNTTCSYEQVVAAMNAQSPTAAAQFNGAPMAQGFLQNFLAAPPPQRQQMLDQAQGIPEAAQFVNLIQPIANTCQNY